MQQGIFLSVNFQCRLSYGVCTPLYAIVCIYICVHVKHSVNHVRVLRIMETLKHQACTVGWVVRLCCSWFSLGKATRISYERNTDRSIQFKKNEKNFPGTVMHILLGQFDDTKQCSKFTIRQHNFSQPSEEGRKTLNSQTESGRWRQDFLCREVYAKHGRFFCTLVCKDTNVSAFHRMHAC